MRGVQIVTALPSRVLLHRRGPHELPLSVFENGVLPESRTLAWENPVSQTEMGVLVEFIEQEETPKHLANILAELFMPIENENQDGIEDWLIDSPQSLPVE